MYQGTIFQTILKVCQIVFVTFAFLKEFESRKCEDLLHTAGLTYALVIKLQTGRGTLLVINYVGKKSYFE